MSQETIIEILEDTPKVENDTKSEITFPKATNIIHINGIEEIDLNMCGPYIVCRFSNKTHPIKIHTEKGVTYFDM